MPAFEPGSIVRVPFPYLERDARQHRPALVVSAQIEGPANSLLWVLMITSAANRRWPDDVSLEEDHQQLGLPVPSLVRTAKIATIESDAVDRLGLLDQVRLDAVRRALARRLAL